MAIPEAACDAATATVAALEGGSSACTIVPAAAVDSNAADVEAAGQETDDCSLVHDPSTILNVPSSKLVVYNDAMARFMLYIYEPGFDADFKVAAIERVKRLLELQEDEAVGQQGCATGVGGSFEELSYPLPGEPGHVPVQRVLYKALGRVYWTEVLCSLRAANSGHFGKELMDGEVLLLVFRLQQRSPARFDLVDVYDEASALATVDVCRASGQDMKTAQAELAALGEGSVAAWAAVSQQNWGCRLAMEAMAQQIPLDPEESPSTAACCFPYWPGDAALVHASPDGADLDHGALDYRERWYLHDSKSLLTQHSASAAGCEEDALLPLARVLSLQLHLERLQIPGAIMSVNAFGMFRQIVNWFLLPEDKQDEIIAMYGDAGAGLALVPAVLHRPPDWEPLANSRLSSRDRPVSALPHLILGLFLERLPGIPNDDDESLAHFEGSNLASCSVSIANREIGESFLHYYGTHGVSWQSQKITEMGDDELLFECRTGDGSTVFDGYEESLHAALAELFVSFRSATRNEHRNYLQLIALVGSDEDNGSPADQSLAGSAYISGRFGNYNISEMQRDSGLTLWNTIRDEAARRILLDQEEGVTSGLSNENMMLDSDIRRLLQDGLRPYLLPGDKSIEADEGSSSSSFASARLSSSELRTKLLCLQRDGWPSHALHMAEGEASCFTSGFCKNVQVRVVPNSARHTSPIRTFRFLREEDKQELNDFIEANLHRLESLRSMARSDA